MEIYFILKKATDFAPALIYAAHTAAARSFFESPMAGRSTLRLAFGRYRIHGKGTELLFNG